ncbi:hypothetical protein [Streptomyces sp. NPDC050485]|uniref:hypothetical protein n=1 Tax=Streptomyces sp. NPDC050485 TaxID=3365617 RepID=UPI00379C08AE
MSPAALPVPAPVPEFLTPRVEAVRQAARAGRREESLALARAISGELAESHGPLHPYTLHALELVAFCAQLAGRPVAATEVSAQAAAGWQHLLTGEHRQVRRQACNTAAFWLTVSDSVQAVRTGTALRTLLRSVFGPDHPSTFFVERRLTAIAGRDREAAMQALRPSGPALLVHP